MVSLLSESARQIDADVPIATIPQCLGEVLDVLEDPEASTDRVVAIIERDPSIASRVLKLVNSPAFGLASPVTALHQACVILGFRSLRQILVQATVVEKLWFGPEVSEFDAFWLWDHSFKTALGAKLLVRAMAREAPMDAEEAYTCGLLHDMGKMLLLQNQTRKFVRAVRISLDRDVPLVQAEREVFGFTDLEVCARLAQRWRLGEVLEDAALRHHVREEAPVAWARGRIVHLASMIAHDAAPRARGWVPERLPEGAGEDLGLDEQALSDIASRVREAATDSDRPR